MTENAISLMEQNLPSEMFDDSVLGYSEAQEDSLIPVLTILQDQSGEVKKRHEKYVEGAEAGMFAVRSLQLFIPTTEKLLFQPCGYTHVWVEWTGEPGEGGAPVAQYPYDDRPEDAEEIVDAQGRKEWRMPETNNRLVETRHHFGNLIREDGKWMPVVIAMSGTNHSVSRQWTTLMKQHRIKGRRAPAFARIYELDTSFTQRGSQSWYKFRVRDHGWVEDPQILDDGFNFAKAIVNMDVAVQLEPEETPIDDDSVPV